MAIVLLVCTKPCFAQTNSSPDDLAKTLSVRVPAGEIDGNFVDALGQVALAFNIPMGIAWLKTAAAQERRSIKYKDGTVLQIIEMVAKTEPNYEVTVVNGVIHVTTKEIPVGQNFLYQSIPEFSAQGTTNWIKTMLWSQVNQVVSPGTQGGHGGIVLTTPAD